MLTEHFKASYSIPSLQMLNHAYPWLNLHITGIQFIETVGECSLFQKRKDAVW